MLVVGDDDRSRRWGCYYNGWFTGRRGELTEDRWESERKRGESMFMAYTEENKYTRFFYRMRKPKNGHVMSND